MAEPVGVIDEGDDVAADGEALGEVLMRGNNVTTGYFDDPDQTAQTFAGGWYHSATWRSVILMATSSCATARKT